MKIDLSKVDTDNFIIKENELFGEEVYLIIPMHIGCTWSHDNLHFRSSLWDKDGNLISAGLPKFFNWGEKPGITAPPETTKGATIVEKVDGSCLIVSKYKGNVIRRTRGTIDASLLPHNGFEIDHLIKKYPKALRDSILPGYSYIYEWVTDVVEARIVVRHPEADIYLLGVIDHANYGLMAQDQVDSLSDVLGVKRPEAHQFRSTSDMLKTIEDWEDREGVCFYFEEDQKILKVKCPWYLALHRMKSELGSFERVVDLFFVMGEPHYNEFYAEVASNFDWEIAEETKGYMSRCCDAMKRVNLIIRGMRRFVAKCKASNLSRKDTALAIQESYGKTSRASYVMRLAFYEDQELDTEAKKKLLYQVIKGGK